MPIDINNLINKLLDPQVLTAIGVLVTIALRLNIPGVTKQCQPKDGAQ